MTKKYLIAILIVGNIATAILFPIAPMTIINTFQAAPWWGKIVITLVLIGAVAFEIFLVFVTGLLQIPASRNVAWIAKMTTGRTVRAYELEDVLKDVMLQGDADVYELEDVLRHAQPQGEQNGKNN